MNWRRADTAAILLLLLAVNAHTQSCGNDDDVVLQRQRINAIRSSIIAHLGPDYYHYNATGNETKVDEATMDDFYAVSNATMLSNMERYQKGAERTVFAERVLSFPAVPLLSPSVMAAPERRSVEAHRFNVLDRFNVQFDFKVDCRQKSDVTKAELVLFQVSSATGWNTDDEPRKQYVEIRSVNVLTGGTRIITGSYVRVNDQGYRPFDVTDGAREWVHDDSYQPLLLEVIIYCFDALDCSQGGVNFVNTTTDVKSVPRLIVNAKNPLEESHGNRLRRQSSGVGACAEGQVLCCLKPLRVNVQTDLQLTYIIEPLTIDINYCQGVCPRTPGGDYMTPAIYSQYSKLTSGPGASLTPCCSGNTYLSVVALMRTVAGTVETITLPDMIVNSCRCA